MWPVEVEQNPWSQPYTLTVCEVLKARGSGARSLASSPGAAIDYNGFVTLNNNLTSLCLHFLIHQMGIIIDSPPLGLLRGLDGIILSAQHSARNG